MNDNYARCQVCGEFLGDWGECVTVGCSGEELRDMSREEAIDKLKAIYGDIPRRPNVTDPWGPPIKWEPKSEYDAPWYWDWDY